MALPKDARPARKGGKRYGTVGIYFSLSSYKQRCLGNFILIQIDSVMRIVQYVLVTALWHLVLASVLGQHPKY